jgi:16S rRNA (guanine966-N2)-methyltransferase
MRVVAGELRGRRIEAPTGLATRPTTDMAREAVFNALNSLDLIRGAAVADLFAGSGALGIEALSRGAAHCTFVERDRNALRTLRGNLAALGLEERCKVVPGDASVLAGALDVDIVLADPPYEFDQWPELLASTKASFVVAEAGRPLDRLDPGSIVGWTATRTKRYGRTWVTFFERSDDPGQVAGTGTETTVGDGIMADGE